jgi:hypothetical protein
MDKMIKGSEFKSLLHVIQTGYGAHPASIQWVLEALSLGVKWPGPPTSIKVKKTWVYTSTPPYVFIA